MRLLQYGLMTLTLLSTAGDADALEVVLQNRKRFVGEVRLAAKTVFVAVGSTTYTIPRGAVKAVRLFGQERLQYALRKRRLGTSADAHFDFGRWLESKFQHAEAEQMYELAVRLSPNHEGAHRALGYKRTNGKWTRTAEDHWRLRSRWLGREGADACFELAGIYEKSGDQKQTEAMLRRALIAWPKHPEALKMMRPFTDRYVSKNTYRPPVEGLWRVIHDYNDHHKKAAFMAYALDFMKLDEELRHARVAGPGRLDDFYTFGATIHAAADGVVYSVNDGFPDNPVGRWRDFRSANTVCIKHPHGEYTVYGHLKNGSITVKPGQEVKTGEVIAHAGNSGSSGWPHMHWAMYDRDGLSLPCTFADFVQVTRDGEKQIHSGRLVENTVFRNSFGGGP